MEDEKLFEHLSAINARLATIETDLCWFKKIVKGLILLVLSVLGIDVAPFVI